MKLSIITVNLNNARGLEKTIHSVRSQTFCDFEYLVIDGGSSDDSVEVIKNNSEKIDYWVSEKDPGIYNAMNKAIRLAKGDYLLFLNSGDWLVNRDTLKEAFLTSFTQDLVYSRQMILEEGVIKRDAGLDVEYISFLSLKNASLPHQSMFISRELFQKVGLYNEDNRIVSDWEFLMLALFKHDCSIRQIDTAISVFDKAGISNAPHTLELQMMERRRVLDKYFHYFMTDYDQFESFMKKKYVKTVLRAKQLYHKIKLNRKTK